MNLSSIFVTWGKVPEGKRQGRILKYRVNFKSGTTNQTESQERNAQTQYLKILGLEEYSNYTITVAAATIKGYGPASQPVVVTPDN